MDIHKCTQDDPWNRASGIWAHHPDAKWVSEVHDTSALHWDYEVRECPWCHLVFEVELPN